MLKYKLNKRIVIFLLVLLIIGGAGGVFAAGLFNSGSENGLVLNLDLAQHNYNSGTKVFTDKSGTGSHGTSASAASFAADNKGNANSAMSFNGTGNYVNLGDVKTLGNFTYSVWVKLDTLNTTGMIFDKEIGGSLWPSVRGYVGTDNKYYFGFHKSSSVSQTFVSVSSLGSGRWYHLVGTYDGSTIKIYIDGVLSSSNNASGIPNNINNKLILGATQMNSSPFYINQFIGSIANFKVYNRALSANEIQTLYNSRKSKVAAGSIQKGLIAHWALDGDGYNATTGRITDKTPYGNNGTNNGATLTTDKTGQANGAMSFNGTSNWIDPPDNGTFDFSNQDFSISSWFKLSQYYNLATTCKSSPIVANDDWGWRMSVGIAGSLGFSYYYTSSLADSISATTTAQLNNWYLVTTVFSKTQNKMQFFVNGKLEAEKTLISANIYYNPADQPHIGAITGCGSQNIPFNGSISDVRIYNRALTADEVSMLYGSYKPKAMAGTLQKGLVLDMPLTSNYTKTVTASSQIMTDKTPYSNNGQNYGATVGSDSTSFNGTSNYIGTTLGSVSVQNNFTFGGWFKTSSTMQIDAELTSGTSGIAGKKYAMGPNNGGTNSEAGLSIGTNGISVYEHGNGYMPAVSVYNSSIGSDWNHIIIVYINKQSKTYLNGVLIHTGLTSPKANVNAPYTGGSSSGYIGGGVYGYFNGSISGVKIYNRALSADEVKSLYDKGR